MKAPDSARSRKSLVWFGVTALLALTAATAQVAVGATGIGTAEFGSPDPVGLLPAR